MLNHLTALDVMTPRTQAIRKFIAAMLIGLVAAQPVLAAEREYRIPLKIRTQGTAPGVGDGVVDTGDNPTPPVLTLAPNTLVFDTTGGVRDTKFSVLTNNGSTPAAVSGITSTADFSVSHNCPNPLPVGIPCTISATPTESAVPGAQYSMALMAPAIEAPAMFQLSTFARPITGPAPALRLDPGLVDFGNTLKPGQTVSGSTILSNVGNADATLGGINSRDGFTVSSDCPTVLPAGQHCTLSASFSSYVPGTHRHDLGLTSGVPDALTSLTFLAYVQSDPSKSPALAFDSRGLSFGILEPGASATQTAHLTNSGTAPAVLQPFQLSSPFSVTSDCPAVLSIGGTCAVSVTYTASTNGAESLMANAQDAARAQLFLDGRVRRDDQASKTVLTPNPLSFGDVPVGQAPSLQAILTNTGPSATSVKSVTLDNTPGGFSQTNDCSSSIAAGASCSISVTFKPLKAEQRSARVNVTFSDDSNISLPVSGTGSGAALSVGPTPVQLGAVMLPGVSQPQTVGLGNSGNLPLSGLAISSTDSRLIVGYGNCTDTLQPKQGCSLTVQYAPDADGPIKSSFQIGSSNGGAATVQVTGQALALVASPASLTFPATHVGVSAADQHITLSNNGRAPVTMDGIGIGGGYRQFGQSNDCGSSLAAGASCAIVVRYTPDQVVPNTMVAQQGVLSVTANGASFTFGLTGTGVNPQLTTAPLSLNLAATVLGQTSPTATITVTNPSGEPATVSGISISQGSAEFAQSNNCGVELAAGASCTVNVQFTPLATGGRSGALSVASSFGINSVALAGQGLPQLALSTTTVSFPPTNFGQTSAPVNFTVTNQATQVATVTGMGISQGTSDFGQSNNCGTELAPGASCTVSVQFTPAATGIRNGTWSVASSMGTYNVSLSGQGLPKLTLSRSTVAFPATNVGQSSAPVSVKVSNMTDQVATLSGTSINQKAADFIQSSDCGTAIAVGASCTMTVQFTPSTTGERSGTVTINSTFGTDSVGLTGTGTQPEGSVDTGVTPSGSSPDNFTHYTITFLDTEVSASSAVRNVKFSNRGTGPLTIQGISQLDGLADFNESNDCGTTLEPGQVCTISLLFTPSALGARTGQVVLLSETGNYAFDLSGKGIGANGQWKADTSVDFGDVAVGSSAQRSFTFQNTGTLIAKNIATSLTGADLTFVSNGCGTADATVSVVAGGTCKVTVKYSPTTAGNLADASLVTTGRLANAPATLALAGNAPPPALAFDPAPSGDYGTITAETSNLRTFILRNTGKFADTLADAPAATGTGFAVTGGTCAKGLSLAVNGSCSVIVTAYASTAGGINGTVTAASTQGASKQLPLAALVIQSAYTLSAAAGTNVAPVSNFGSLTAGSSASAVKYYYLRDDSNLAAVSTKLVALQGDSSFSVTDILAVDYSGITQVVCTTTATGSATPCASGASSRAIRVGVKFAPTSAGTKVTTLHLEHNGSPGSTDLQLSGTGVFNATGAWSSSSTSTVALTSAATSYGTQTTGTTAMDKTFYVRNVGTNGAEAIGFALAGDTSQFQLVSVKRMGPDSNGNPVSASCAAGGVIAADKLSATPCLAGEFGNNTYPHVQVIVRFAPTAIGNYSLTVTPTTNNGTVLPAAATLTGAGQFNPTGAWSSSSTSTVALTSAATSYGTQTTGTTALDKTFYVRNVGTNGVEAIGFVLSGDTSQFQLVSVKRMGPDSNGNPNSGACAAGGVIAADKLSATPCLAGDFGNNTYPHVQVTVRFAPTAIGNYSLTVTPTTNNGTILPGAATLTGAGQFNPTGAWSSSSTSTVALTSAATNYGIQTGATTTDKTFYVRNVGTNGVESVGFVLSGDTSQFQLVGVKRMGPDSNGNPTSAACAAGGVIAADKLSATPCLAGDFGNNTYPHVQVTVRFASTAAGNYSLTVTPTTNNGTALPGAITLTGVRQ